MQPTTATPERGSQKPAPSGYVLVMLRRGENDSDYRLYAAAHTDFIEGLIKQNRILLGGAFATRAGDVEAAYVLRAGDVDEARTIAEADPFATAGVCRPECRRWELIGINPDAVDEALVVRPDDIA